MQLFFQSSVLQSKAMCGFGIREHQGEICDDACYSVLPTVFVAKPVKYICFSESFEAKSLVSA